MLPKYRTAIFVHGCFWHCHDCRYGQVVPATRPKFWTAKRKGNVDRDAEKKLSLESQGWTVINDLGMRNQIRGNTPLEIGAGGAIALRPKYSAC